MDNKLVVVKKLWEGSEQEHFDYSDNFAEPIALEHVAKYLNKKVTSVTKGYCPSHDGAIDGELVEVKFQSGWKWKIEHAHADGSPSGISNTEAKCWIIINQGRNNKFGTIAGKVRMPEVEFLKELVNEKIANGESKIYPKDDNGPGAMYVEIDPRELGGKDGWLDCDVTVQIVDGGIAYDFNESRAYKKNR